MLQRFYYPHVTMFLLFCSGAITKHFVTAKKLMANFILEAFFSPSQIQKYVNDKSRTYLTAEQIGKYYNNCILFKKEKV